MIHLNHVFYQYPGALYPAINDLSLTIGAGEFVVVCGPSGAGKSTFLRLLNGLVPHFYGGQLGGAVRVWGRSTLSHQPRDLSDLMGFVFQDPEAQLVVDVVEDEIVFTMENLGLPQALMRRRVEEVLDQLGIAHLRRRQVTSLSGGERQRVAIAGVLAAQPRALVLDEPTSQIDPYGAEEVLSALQKLNDDLGLTIVLCEHRLERVVQYADRMVYFPAPTPADAPPQPVLVGAPRDVLAQIELAPPLVQLGQALGWQPLPLTIKEARRFVGPDQRSPTTDHRPTTTNHRPTAARKTRDSRQETADTNATSQRSTLNAQRSTLNAQRSAQGPAVMVRQLHYTYGEHEALYDLSLMANAGEVLALMGRNGSGKTTLLKLLAGLLKPTQGRVILAGGDTASALERGLVGYVPQDPRQLLFHDTLREELEFTLSVRKTEDGRRKTEDNLSTAIVHRPSSSVEMVEATLAQFGLTHLAGRYPRDLSGGEAQRAALAAVLVANPPIVLLDEPTRGLDYHAKAELGTLLRQLAAEGRSIIIATHDVELVAAYADRVALLGDGELVVSGPVRDVLSDSLIFSSQIAKLFPGSGWLTVADALAGAVV